MRPIDKGMSPQIFTNYQDAKPFLTDRLGTYCSFCERLILTGLAVEHIQPKSRKKYAHLEKEWKNFLLACVNCNSAKSKKDVSTKKYLLPDRDNTFPFFEYEKTGVVKPRGSAVIKSLAKNTIDLVALNRFEHPKWDDTNMRSALERFSQRIQVWTQALEARDDYNKGEVNIRRIAAEAASTGFFSIWLEAFTGVPAVREAIIALYKNTAADCFDVNFDPITPRPKNKLSNSGKS